ncbi:MAG: ABC transporter permease [Synergistaceae bacterium]|nr:ABC transporter permease [Synergistaceae bacterium]
MRTGISETLLRWLCGDRTSSAAVPICVALLSTLVSSAALLALGHDPVTAMAAFLRGSGLMPKPSYAGGQSMLTDFMSYLGILAPMMLASLSVIFCLKAGMFNIGVSGQMLAAGFLATALVGYAKLPSGAARPLVVLIGAAVGGLMGAAVGYLKYLFNIHEVVSCIMINHITSYVTGFFIDTRYVDVITRSSRACSASSRLTIAGVRMGGVRAAIPLGILIAITAVFVVRFLMERTTAGFGIKIVGLNRDAARYAGVPVGRSYVFAMSIGGALAGLAGVTYYLGYYNSIVPKALPSLGYDAIAVALLGNLSPPAAVFSSMLVTIFQKGGVYMSSVTGAPREIASVVIALLLLFSACGAYIRERARSALGKRGGG